MMQNLEVVLVHGLWHQPAHFDRLADDLRGQGVLVHVPRLHGGSLAADTAAVQQPGHGRGMPARTAWQSVESTYLLCEQDRALSPDLQERMARRCTSTVSLSSSHSPFISRSRQLADLIVKT